VILASPSLDEPAGPSSPSGFLSPLALVTNVLGLAFLVYGVSAYRQIGFEGVGPLVATVLLILASSAWLVWVVGRTWSLPAASRPMSIAAMALCGAALTGFVPLAMLFPAVAAMAACLFLPAPRAAAVVGMSIAALMASVVGNSAGVGTALGAPGAILLGAVVGVGRRASHHRDQQQAYLHVAEARAEAERARAELLAGRNHLARELHDVLAHTLSALALQLQALDALMPAGPPSPEVGAQLEEIRRLVREGLDEARGAVAALREDLPPLEARLARLAAERGAALAIAGSPRPLPPEVALGLYRAAQEGLTNALRHAPGAEVDLALSFSEESVTLFVTNREPAAPPSEPDRGGGGYGLQGIRERVLLLGGSVKAGPHQGGWRLAVWVPVSS
jgi:signal transduction histidine kinase